MTDRYRAVLDLSADDRDRVVQALVDTAERYGRAASTAAGELERAKTAGEVKDDRPGAVKIARMLAEADTLRRTAETIRQADVVVHRPLDPDDVARQLAGVTMGDRPMPRPRLAPEPPEDLDDEDDAPAVPAITEDLDP